MATETQPQLLDAVGGFAQRTMRYQALLAIDDQANNPWLTTNQKNAIRRVIGGAVVSAAVRDTSTATGLQSTSRIVTGLVEKANVVKA